MPCRSVPVWLSGRCQISSQRSLASCVNGSAIFGALTGLSALAALFLSVLLAAEHRLGHRHQGTFVTFSPPKGPGISRLVREILNHRSTGR